MNLVAEPEIEYHRNWTGRIDKVVVTFPRWNEDTGHYRITELDTGLGGLRTDSQVYSNRPDAIKQGARRIQVKQKETGGVITFEAGELYNKQTQVEFWPHGATERQFVLTASSEAQ